jgi:hypothetical protein
MSLDGFVAVQWPPLRVAPRLGTKIGPYWDHGSAACAHGNDENPLLSRGFS